MKSAPRTSIGLTAKAVEAQSASSVVVAEDCELVIGWLAKDRWSQREGWKEE